ncbi:MAG: M1 family metallopeptidase [Saprospiraceae bacterium]
MKFSWFIFIIWIIIGLPPIYLKAQCADSIHYALSKRTTNYNIKTTLDDKNNLLESIQTIHFVNQTNVDITSLQFYMYLNSFKNTESSFLKGTTKIFGNQFSNRRLDEWGWISIEKITRDIHLNNVDLTENLKYIQCDDGNLNDQSVIEVLLNDIIAPGDTAIFHLKWKAKIPKTIARCGYSKDFYFLCHWFPQLGVYEKNDNGLWGWNCHQFLRSTEFYADFGNYNIEITADEKFVVGASGCLISEIKNQDKTITRCYRANDVIDFAWTAYPNYIVREEKWKGIDIRLLLPSEYTVQSNRYIQILIFALEYMESRIAKYPYPSITVVCPPLHGLKSGLMEYPTLITTGSVYGMPNNIRTTESLVVHEFIHQYFMAVVANNEKEEPWLDEGFSTYYEDRIIDTAFGKSKSLVDILGIRFDNRELTRLEYTTMRNPREGIIARPAWFFNETNYKSLIYSKTATTLHTLQNLIGENNIDRIIQTYYNNWKFKHPKGLDFINLMKSELLNRLDSSLARRCYELIKTSIYNGKVLDYSVSNITTEISQNKNGIFDATNQINEISNYKLNKIIHSKVQVERLGDWIFPVEILLIFENGSSQTIYWDGEEGRSDIDIYNSSKVISAHIDPNQKILLDINLNNNSYTIQPARSVLMWYSNKLMFHLQNILQSISMLL